MGGVSVVDVVMGTLTKELFVLEDRLVALSSALANVLESKEKEIASLKTEVESLRAKLDEKDAQIAMLEIENDRYAAGDWGSE